MEFQIKPFYETGLFPLKTPKIQRFSSKGEMSKFSTNWGDSPFPASKENPNTKYTYEKLKNGILTRKYNLSAEAATGGVI